MDTRRIAEEIAEAIAATGTATYLREPDIWVPYFGCDPVLVVRDDPWPVGVVVSMFEENQRGERRFVGTRIYQPPP